MTSPTITIIGAGPRGLSVLERIAAHGLAGDPLVPPGLTVHLVDPHPPGGQVWRSAQPNELLMNTVAGDATLFLDETVITDGPRNDGLTLMEWALALDEVDSSGRVDAALQAEIDALTPLTSVSRRLYGTYLGWFFDTARAALERAGIALVVHEVRAVSVTRSGDREIVELDDGERLPSDTVVLTLGHDRVSPTPAERVAAEAADAGNWVYLAPGNPIDQHWDLITAGAPVIVRGLGLNFFDALALLTIGRGGTFTRASSGELEYAASGREPVLWAGSTRGVPFKAKSIIQSPLPPQVRRYPDDATLQRLTSRTSLVNFDREVWGWVRKEALWQYYLAQVGVTGSAALASVFDAAPADTVPSPSQLEVVFPGIAHDFDPDRTGDPFTGVTFESQEAAEAAATQWIADDLLEARKGASSAIRAGDRAISMSRMWLFPLATFGGFDAQSHPRFDRWFGAYANSIAGGPPAIRNEQLLALRRAGVVRLIPPTMAVETTVSGATATSAAVPGWSMTARALVEARIHGVSLSRTLNPLLRSLRDQGRCRSYLVGDTPAFDTDGLEVTPAPYRLVDAAGEPADRIFALGIPLGTHVGTSLTAFARSNSAFLREADSVSRAALAGASTPLTLENEHEPA